jgi:hypothetical protein
VVRWRRSVNVMDPTRGYLGSSAEWKMVKTVVNKRERIYAQLASEFNTDSSSPEGGLRDLFPTYKEYVYLA